MKFLLERWFLISFLALLEILSSTYWIEYLPMNFCRWVHLGSGLLIAICLIWPSYGTHSLRAARSHRWPMIILFGILIAWSLPKLNQLYQTHPLDYTQADMLPVLKIMAERWLAGTPVYQMIYEIWGGILPVYFPAFYIPFIPAVLFQFELRWIPYSILVLSIAYVILSKPSHVYSIFIFIPIGLWFDHAMLRNQGIFVWTQEGIVYGYYVLLAYFLVTKQYGWLALLAAACLCSRYSGIFFILAVMPALWLVETRSISIRYGILFLAFVLCILTVGKAWPYLLDLASVPTHYMKNIMAYPEKHKSVLHDGLGILPMLGIAYHRMIFYIQLILLFGVVVVMLLGIRRWYHSFYLPGFLKLSLVIFYNFLILPYSYLMYTSVWVTIAFVFLYAHAQPSPAKESTANE
jgi:hypothetical protein